LNRLDRLVRKVEEFGFHCRVQQPITLTNYREPAPDLAVVRGSAEMYVVRHPGPAEVAAALEVSDSSLDFDRTTKSKLYAEAGIAVYWIVNFPENALEVYEDPRPAEDTYARHRTLRAGAIADLTLQPNLAISVNLDELLPISVGVESNGK
jgi:Uma2 family endonuclease